MSKNKKKIDKFVEACERGEEEKVTRMYQKKPDLLNKFKFYKKYGITGLQQSINKGHHNLTRWLLERPELDANIYSPFVNTTAIHHASTNIRTPLDILIHLTRISSWKTISMECRLDRINLRKGTALDKAIELYNHSATLYLAWLGLTCRESNVDRLTWLGVNCRFNEENEKEEEEDNNGTHWETNSDYCTSLPIKNTTVDLESWIKAGCQQEAQFWAVAANDIEALKRYITLAHFFYCF